MNIKTSSLYQIFYLHGFNSSIGSLSARRLVSEVGIEIHELTYDSYGHYEENLVFLRSQIEKKLNKDAKLIIVGTSLGGFYAGMLGFYYGVGCILFNPVIKPLEDFQKVLSKLGNSDHPYYFSKKVIASYPKKLQISQAKYLIFQAFEDELLDYQARKEFFECFLNVDFISIHSKHTIEKFALLKESILRFIASIVSGDKN